LGPFSLAPKVAQKPFERSSVTGFQLLGFPLEVAYLHVQVPRAREHFT
jgi:hypothetical protein